MTPRSASMGFRLLATGSTQNRYGFRSLALGFVALLSRLFMVLDPNFGIREAERAPQFYLGGPTTGATGD
jgi:hypothetical protein